MEQTRKDWIARWNASDETWAAIRKTYYPISMDLTTPDGANLSATFYQYRKDSGKDIPTIICFNPNGGRALYPTWDWLLKKGSHSPEPFQVVVFDCRKTGLDRADQLVIDGDTVYQAVQGALGISEKNVHFLGLSMGGALSAKVAALHPNSGRVVNLQSFANLSDVIIHSPVIEIPFVGDTVNGSPIAKGMIVNSLLTFHQWHINPKSALNTIKDRLLIAYHPTDQLIPMSVGAISAVEKPLHTLRLSFKSTVRVDNPERNPHGASLCYFEDSETGLNASKRILNFLLGTDVFVGKRAFEDKRKHVF